MPSWPDPDQDCTAEQPNGQAHRHDWQTVYEKLPGYRKMRRRASTT